MKTVSLFRQGKVRAHAAPGRPLSHDAATDRGILLILALVGVPVAVAIVMVGAGWV
jgi:hypothetical protein